MLRYANWTLDGTPIGPYLDRVDDVVASYDSEVLAQVLSTSGCVTLVQRQFDSSKKLDLAGSRLKSAGQVWTISSAKNRFIVSLVAISFIHDGRLP